jgi:hypothetical protein
VGGQEPFASGCDFQAGIVDAREGRRQGFVEGMQGLESFLNGFELLSGLIWREAQSRLG